MDEGPLVTEVVEACRRLARERGITVAFRHQPGHRTTWAGRDDFAQFNARADTLAPAGAPPAGCPPDARRSGVGAAR